jgi:hypothetical protein
MGMTASSMVHEGRGTLKGKGAAHVAVFLALIAAAIPFGYVKPRLAAVDRDGREARVVGDRFVDYVREGRFADARSLCTPSLQERLSEAQLQAHVEQGRRKHPERWDATKPTSTHVGPGSTARVGYEFGTKRVASDITLERDGKWRVSDLKRFLFDLGE